MKDTQTNKFWQFRAAADNNPPELILYGDISSTSWWGDEITPEQFNADLLALGDVDEIIVRINSGGGDVFAATAIYTRLKSHKAKITVIVDGWAASAATVIAMAGDVIKIPAAASFMIHDPSMGVMGYFGETEFAKFREELVVVKNCIINAYATKTHKEKTEISALMTAETWYTGEEAVKAGFCDEVLFGENKAQAIITDFSRYKNAPISLLNHHPKLGDDLLNKKEESTEMEIKTVDELKARYPLLASKIAEDAVNTERARIKAIEDIALDGFEEATTAAKYENPVAAAEFAMQIIAQQKKQGANYLLARDKDVATGNVNNTGSVAQEGVSGQNSNNPFDAAIDKLFPDKR